MGLTKLLFAGTTDISIPSDLANFLISVLDFSSKSKGKPFEIFYEHFFPVIELTVKNTC